MGLIPRLPRFVFACFKSIERTADRLTGAVGPVFVALAWFLISVGIVYFFDVVAPQLSWPLLQIPLCILCATNMLGHYYLACTVRPGTPDDMKGTGEETGWMWAQRRRHSPDLGVSWGDSRSRAGDWGTTIERGRIGRCKRCFKQKPERAHHCKVCKSCILKFDHHCPWINQCVGLRNERHFVLFMAWFVISCSFFVFLGYEYLWPAIAYQSDDWHSKLPPTGYVLIYVMALALGFAVSIMLFWHLYLVSSAESTVENYDFARYREVAKTRGTEFVNSYDLGRMKNLTLFFNLGPSGYPLYTLLLPLRCAPCSDGVSWTRRPGYTKHSGIGEGDEMTDVEDDDDGDAE